MFAQQLTQGLVYQFPGGAFLNNDSGGGGAVVWDLRYSSDSNSSGGSSSEAWGLGGLAGIRMLGCGHWQPPNDVLFQLACVLLAGGLLAFDTPYGALLLHSLFFVGYLLMSVWSWVILCAPDFFSWNFAFLLLNGVQTMSLIYSIRPVRFCQELEEVYTAIFLPLRVPRSLYKRLVGAEYCSLMTLNEGEHYATQSITKTDKLGLLISGTMNAYSNRTLLHTIKAKQFIDSPEFESSNSGEEKFQVSIVAGSLCRYLFWPRQSLEYLLVQEPYLASVLNMVLGRDITTKLYALNERVSTVEGSRLDIRLPSVSPNLRTRRDIRKAVVGVTSPGEEGAGNGVGEGEGMSVVVVVGATTAVVTPPVTTTTTTTNITANATTTTATSTTTTVITPVSDDDSDENDEANVGMSEKVELLNGHTATASPPIPILRSSPPSRTSSRASSRHSALHFDI